MKSAKVPIKKATVSLPEAFSNLLLVSSVVLVVMARLLGDNLALVLDRVLREGWVMVQQTTDYLTGLLR